MALGHEGVRSGGSGFRIFTISSGMYALCWGLGFVVTGFGCCCFFVYGFLVSLAHWGHAC